MSNDLLTAARRMLRVVSSISRRGTTLLPLFMTLALFAAREVGACTIVEAHSGPLMNVAATTDVIVEARVDHYQGDRLVVVPVAVHKGSVPNGPLEIGSIPAEPSGLTLDLMAACEIKPLPLPEAGKTYLFGLFDRVPGESAWRAGYNISDAPLAGTSAARNLLRGIRGDAPVTPWMRSADGRWLTRALLPKRIFATGESIDVVMQVRNASGMTLLIRHRNWPLEERSVCALEGTGLTGVSIPLPQLSETHQTAARSIAGHELELAPGETFSWMLNRIINPNPGLESTTQLGYQYSPPRPGRYDVDVVCSGFTDGMLRAEGLKIVIRDPSRSPRSPKGGR